MHLNRSLYRGSHSYCSHSAAKFYSWESLQRAWSYSQLHFPPWNRLHPQVVCQSPEASYSDAAAVLNLMLCLAHPTRGHWKVRLGLHKIKREMRGREKKRKWKGVTWPVFQTCLPWRSFWTWKNSRIPFARLLWPRQQWTHACLFTGNLRHAKGEGRSHIWLLRLFPPYRPEKHWHR